MNKISTAGALSLVLATSLSVHAAGFQLWEYSTTNLGRAFAGVGVVGDDFSSIGYNPAGMNYNTTSGASVGATTIGIRSHAEGTVRYGDGSTVSGKTNPYIVRVLPNGFAQYKLNDRATMGLGVYSPFGLATDYNKNWFGQTHALLSQITAIDVSPALSYKVTDTVSIGGAVNIQQVDAKMSGRIEASGSKTSGKSNLAGDDVGVGYTLGATYEPLKGTRFGVSYRSKIDHKLEGINKIRGFAGPLTPMNSNKDIYAKVTTPESVILSAWQKINEVWSISATARWTRWTQFKDLNIYNTSNNSLVSATKENWQNTWFYGLGADYQYCKNLIFRFGAAYDQSAVRSAQNRTARIPDSQRVWTTFGASYLYQNWQLDGGYAHLFIHEAVAQHGSAGASGFNTKYRSSANIFSLNAQYKF